MQLSFKQTAKSLSTIENEIVGDAASCRWIALIPTEAKRHTIISRLDAKFEQTMLNDGKKLEVSIIKPGG